MSLYILVVTFYNRSGNYSDMCFTSCCGTIVMSFSGFCNSIHSIFEGKTQVGKSNSFLCEFVALVQVHVSLETQTIVDVTKISMIPRVVCWYISPKAQI